MGETEVVRRCRACGKPAVLLETAWQHSTYGAQSGYSTDEWRCQDCGAGFVIRPWPRLLGLAIAGVLLIPTCIGIPFLGLAWWRWKQDDWNPPVPGAKPPERRFRSGPKPRVCAQCGWSAPAARITAHTHNGLPTGTEYEHECIKCGATFTIESWWGMCFSAMSGSAILAASVAILLFVESWGWKLGGGLGLGLVAAFLLGQVAWRLVNRMRYPEVPGS